MNTPRMTEQELQEVHRRMRISKSKAGVAMPRMPRTSMYKSKLEAAYAAHLDLLVKAGEVKRWEYEPWRLWLSRGTVNPVTGKLEGHASYRPDFLVVLPGGLERRPELHEVKGKWIKNKRDSITHLKWAAQKYGDVFTFRLIEWNGHGWDGKYVVEP